MRRSVLVVLLIGTAAVARPANAVDVCSYRVVATIGSPCPLSRGSEVCLSESTVIGPCDAPLQCSGGPGSFCQARLEPLRGPQRSCPFGALRPSGVRCHKLLVPDPATATPTFTPTATSMPTGTATSTATVPPTAPPTASATENATATGTATGIPSGTPSGTPTATGVPTGTATSTVTVPPTATLTAPPTASATEQATATVTATGIPTGTASATATATGTPAGTAAAVVGGARPRPAWGV